MRLAYLDCVGGLAGDMMLAALLDAGAPEQVLREVPGRLGLDGVELRLERVERHGIGALHLDVLDHGQRAESSPAGRVRVGAQLGIDPRPAGSRRPRPARPRAGRCRCCAVSPKPREASTGSRRKRSTSTSSARSTRWSTSSGRSRCLRRWASSGWFARRSRSGEAPFSSVHGALPLPAPATARLLRGAQVVGVELDAELVTPTGGALATGLADAFGPIPAMQLASDGFGAGTLNFPDRANVVRVLLGSDAEPAHTVVLLETNLDDLLPELIPDAADRCLEAGALDVWTAPVTMKKGRPGIVFSALARPVDEDAVASTILEHTSALGVRVSSLQRYELDRELRSVDVDGHEVRIKLGRLDGRGWSTSPPSTTTVRPWHRRSDGPSSGSGCRRSPPPGSLV